MNKAAAATAAAAAAAWPLHRTASAGPVQSQRQSSECASASKDTRAQATWCGIAARASQAWAGASRRWGAGYMDAPMLRDRCPSTGSRHRLVLSPPAPTYKRMQARRAHTRAHTHTHIHTHTRTHTHTHIHNVDNDHGDGDNDYNQDDDDNISI